MSENTIHDWIEKKQQVLDKLSNDMTNGEFAVQGELRQRITNADITYETFMSCIKIPYQLNTRKKSGKDFLSMGVLSGDQFIILQKWFAVRDMIVSTFHMEHIMDAKKLELSHIAKLKPCYIQNKVVYSQLDTLSRDMNRVGIDISDTEYKNFNGMSRKHPTLSTNLDKYFRMVMHQCDTPLKITTLMDMMNADLLHMWGEIKERLVKTQESWLSQKVGYNPFGRPGYNIAYVKYDKPLILNKYSESTGGLTYVTVKDLL